MVGISSRGGRERARALVQWTICLPSLFPYALSLSGLKAHLFHGLANTHELQCSGELLDSSASLLSLSLFSLRDDRVLASANIATRTCLTSGHFSSCHFHPADARQSKLRTLVITGGGGGGGGSGGGGGGGGGEGVARGDRGDDYDYGEKRWFGCNITALSGGRSTIYFGKLAVHRQRLVARPFHGFTNVKEVECNGDVLASDESLLYMILYSPASGDRIASVNVAAKECLTSGMFSSCVAGPEGVRFTRLRSLVVDLRPGESRRFGCNITSVTAEGTTKVWSRVIVVHKSRLTCRPFRGYEHIQELRCSAQPLPAGFSVLFMALYRVQGDSSIASVNVGTRECTTSDRFSSCLIDSADSRQIQLKTLLVLSPSSSSSDFSRQRGEVTYGCNITVVSSGRRTNDVTWTLSKCVPSLSSRPFRGIEHVQEVDCSARPLEANVQLLSMALYTRHNDAIVVSANIGTRSCLTRDLFSSCLIDQGNPRRTSLKALVLAQGPPARTLHFGCNVTTFVEGGRIDIKSWFISVTRLGMSSGLFRGMHTVQQLECSAGTLPTNSEVLFIILYQIYPKKTLVRANLGRSQSCTSSDLFAACDVSDSDRQAIRLKALIPNGGEGWSRGFGCNVTAALNAQEEKYVETFIWTHYVRHIRLFAEPFQGLEEVQQVTCSGHPLPPGSNIFFMVLYHQAWGGSISSSSSSRVLGQLNAKDRQCTTSQDYVMCHISPKESRRSELKALVADLAEGLKWEAFRGLDAIQEVRCSGGEVLDPDAEVMFALLYQQTPPNAKVLATMNVIKKQCTTLEEYSSCYIAESESRLSSLSALVSDLAEGQSRGYGCNVSALMSGVRMETLTWSVTVRRRLASLTVGPFQGSGHIQQVVCSGDTLPSDADLMSIVLYTQTKDRVLSILNLRKRQCTMASEFVLCSINDGDSRRSVVKILVLDLVSEEESRVYGCDVTMLTSKGRSEVLSWSVTVRYQSLKTKPFLGLAHMQELECSVEGLPSGSNLYAMFIYERHRERILSSMDIQNKQCSTSEYFNSCLINSRDPRRSKLRLVISDLSWGERREYGCNASIKTSDGRFKVETWFLTVGLSRLRAQSFQAGFPGIQSVECSGRTLPSDSDLLSMVLFQRSRSQPLAIVNLRKKSCTTSNIFVACHLDDSDSRRSVVRALVSDLLEGQSRVYGCNVTSLVSNVGQVRLLSWSLLVRRPRLISRPFYGRPDIRELECSGSGLDATYDVMSLVVYRVPQDNVLASAQVLKRHCATSGATFSSCLIDVRDTRRSKLKVLVTDPWGGQRGVYGCNVTSFWADGRATITSWFLEFVTPPARTFHGYPPITEVECTGSDLAPDLDILSIVIYLSRTDHVVASANLGKKECSTSRAFSSCDFDARDSRRTRVRVLATGGDGGVEERWRVLGCNLTSFETGGRVRTVTLMLSVDPRTIASSVVMDFLKAGPVRSLSVLLATSTYTSLVFFPPAVITEDEGGGGGLSTLQFQGSPNITEVQCSGRAMDLDGDLLTLVLFSLDRHRILASVNLKSRECTTSTLFTSCLIDEASSHRTKLRTLIVDLPEGRSRGFGCNVTWFKSSGRLVTRTSLKSVSRTRE
ncbi:hypothetical protein ACOMHN_035409 [Nucella lapillus]